MPSHTDSAATPSAASPPRDKGLVERLLAPTLIPYLILALFSGLFTYSHVERTQELSVLDEYQYYDYLVKVPTQLFVRQGEEVGEQARRELSCRGITFIGKMGVSCTGVQQPDSKFPIDGKNSADIYTPLYFGATWLMAQPLTWFGLDLLEAGRAVGAIWLFLGMAFLFALQRRLLVPKAMALGVSLLLISLQATFWATQFISTDAPTYFVIALVGLAAVRFAQGVGRGCELPVVSLIAVMFKIQNIAGVMMAVIALLIHHWLTRRAERRGDRPATADRSPAFRRTAIVGGVSAFAAVLSYAGWLAIRAATSVDSGSTVDIETRPLLLTDLVRESIRFITQVGLTGAYPGQWVGPVTTGFIILGIGGLAIALFTSTGPLVLARRSIAGGVLVTLLTFGPILTVMTAIVSGQYIPLTVRYGAVFVVAFGLLIGMMAHEIRIRSWIPLTAGLLIAAVTVVT